MKRIPPSLPGNLTLILIVLFLSLFTCRVSLAQHVPKGDEAGAASARFDSDVRKAEKAVSQKRKAPELEVKEEKAPPVPAGPAFLVSDIKITGNTIFKTEELASLYKGYLGKEVTFGDLQAVADKIKDKYKAKGYATVIVYVPEQEVKEGRVEIKIAEGRMGNLIVEGNKWYPSKLIRRSYHTKKGEVLNVLKVERDILRISNNPDVEIHSVMSQGKEPETVDVAIKVKDYFPYYAGVTTDDKGTRLSGKDRAMLTFRSTDAAASNDSFYLTLLYSRHANAQSISYLLPVDTYGTKVGVSFSHFNLKLGKEYTDITGDTLVITPYIEKELMLSPAEEAYLHVGMDIQSIKKHFRGITTADDQLRVPYFDLQYTKNDLWGRTTLTPKFSFGTSDFLGASSFNHPTASRAETGGFFFKYETSMVRVQRAFLESYCIIRATLQASPQTLTPAEQFQIGGADTVRGYPEGDFLADTGAIFNLDWIFPLYLMPKDVKFPYSDTPLRNQVQPVIFADFGGGRLNKELPLERRDKFLIGVGGGVRVRLYKNLYARIEWAKAIGAKPEAGSGPSTFHFSVQSEL